MSKLQARAKNGQYRSGKVKIWPFMILSAVIVTVVMFSTSGLSVSDIFAKELPEVPFPKTEKELAIEAVMERPEFKRAEWLRAKNKVLIEEEQKKRDDFLVKEIEHEKEMLEILKERNAVLDELNSLDANYNASVGANIME